MRRDLSKQWSVHAKQVDARDLIKARRKARAGVNCTEHVDKHTV